MTAGLLLIFLLDQRFRGRFGIDTDFPENEQPFPALNVFLGLSKTVVDLLQAGSRGLARASSGSVEGLVRSWILAGLTKIQFL